MKKFRSSVCALAAVCVSALVTPSASAETALNSSAAAPKSGLYAVIVLFAVLAVCFGAMAFVVKQGKTGHANVPWAVLAILLSGVALIVATVGYNFGTVYTKPDGDPKDTVVDFFNSIKTGDYPTAYGCLSDYSGLGLENTPQDDIGKAVYEALKLSYDYTIMGGATVNKLTAFVPVRVKYLDLDELGSHVSELVNQNLEKIVESTPRNQVYDANDNYLPEITEKAYTQAVERLISKPETYYTAEQINVELEYENGQWYIVTSQQLLNAIAGGTLL